MTGDAKFNHAAGRDIVLPKNPCGAVFGVALDGAWSGTSATVRRRREMGA